MDTSSATSDAGDGPGAEGDPLVAIVGPRGDRELARLVWRSAADDHDAFAALYDATAPRVYGLAYRILGSSAQAEEVSRDAYLEVWRTARRFDADSGSAIAWIMAIAHRRAVDRLRALRRRAGAASSRNSAPSEEPHRPPEVWQRPITTAEAAGVRDALLRLTPTQRETLVLAYLDGHLVAHPAELTAIVTALARTAHEDADSGEDGGPARPVGGPSAPEPGGSGD